MAFEANYTFSKVLSDGDGDLQVRFQAFLDFAILAWSAPEPTSTRTT